MMKLLHAPASPYARKVRVVLHETELIDKTELVVVAPGPVKRDAKVLAHNPTGKVPTLLTETGQAIYDSRVIVEYLDLRAGTGLIPNDARRIPTLVLQSLADEALDAAILVRYETVMRPEEKRWPEWIDGQWDKVRTSIAVADKDWGGHLAGSVDIGQIALGCLLGYVDFRFAHDDWRARHPNLAKWYEAFSRRPSMLTTAPQ